MNDCRTLQISNVQFLDAQEKVCFQQKLSYKGLLGRPTENTAVSKSHKLAATLNLKLKDETETEGKLAVQLLSNERKQSQTMEKARPGSEFSFSFLWCGKWSEAESCCLFILCCMIPSKYTQLQGLGLHLKSTFIVLTEYYWLFRGFNLLFSCTHAHSNLK